MVRTVKQLIAIAFAYLVLGAAGPSLAASLEEDVQRYIAIFQGPDAASHNRAVEELAAMGLSDPRIYDPLEKRILAEHQAVENQRGEKDRVARYIRALGFSGQEKYTPTLRRFVDNPVYQRYAREALQQQPDYQRWNPIISARESFDPSLSDDDNRVMNMLRSDDLMLMRIAGKRVYFAPHDRTLARVAEQVRKHYSFTPTFDNAAPDLERLDAVAWLVKALGKTTAYDDLLQQVRESAPTRKVRSAADSALRHVR